MGWLAKTLYLNVCDAPKAHFGRFRPPALTCPFGISQTPYRGGLRHPAESVGPGVETGLHIC